MTGKAKKPQLNPYPRQAPCPCGSGKDYEACCARKKFRFEVDARGKITKSIPIHPKLKPELEDAHEEFRKMFGRKPGPNDPVFFQQHVMGEEDFWQQALTAARAAKVREELIFAWRRTGFIVGRHSRNLMPDSEYEEWQDAVEEYFSLKEEGHDPFFAFTYLTGPEYERYTQLVNLLDGVIIALGFAHSRPKALGNSVDYFRYLLLGRAMRSLRTIRAMYKTRYDDDCLAIARAIYEAYLRSKLLRRVPSSSQQFEAILLHEVGAFPTKIRKNGKPQYGVCVNPRTGEEFDVALSNGKIIEISGSSFDMDIYHDLYPLLSGQVHPGFTKEVLASVQANSADVPHEGDSIQAIILILTISFLLLLEVSQSNFLRKKTSRDLLHISKRVHKELIQFIYDGNNSRTRKRSTQHIQIVRDRSLTNLVVSDAASVAWMSEATSGGDMCPAYRCAHAGYALQDCYQRRLGFQALRTNSRRLPSKSATLAA